MNLRARAAAATRAPLRGRRRRSVADPSHEGANQTWTVMVPRQAGPRDRLRELWFYRHLIPFFGKRLLEKNYTRSYLGILWIPLRPLLTVASRALIFGAILNAPSAGLPYFLFFLTGMTAWALFDRSLFWATRSIELNSKIATKLYFPRLLLPIAAFVPAVLDFLVYGALLVLTLLGYWLIDGESYLRADLGLVLTLAAVALILCISLGLGLFLSVLGAYTRDIRFSLGYLLTFWFFMTPVIFPLSAIPDDFKPLAALNPLTAPVEMFREGLYGVGEVQTLALVITLSVALVACLVGAWFFSRWEATSVDNL